MALHEQMKTWDHEQFDKFCAVSDRFAAYGYMIDSEPLEGQFDAWIDQLMTGWKDFEKRVEGIRRVWGFRGRSKALLAHLHKRIPEPVWGVEVRP